jgi:predicted small secreted protein
MMRPVKRSRVIPALALTAALTLAGCSGGVGSDPAVTVDGEAFSVNEVQQATTQLNEVAANLKEPSQFFQQTTPQQVVTDLAVLPVLDQIFTGTPAEATDVQVRGFLGENGVSDPGDGTIDVTRSRQYQQRLSDVALAQDPAMREVVQRAQELLATPDALAAVDVDVNPRYGSWDITGGGLVPRTPEWIQTADNS